MKPSAGILRELESHFDQALLAATANNDEPAVAYTSSQLSIIQDELKGMGEEVINRCDVPMGKLLSEVYEEKS